MRSYKLYRIDASAPQGERVLYSGDVDVPDKIRKSDLVRLAASLTGDSSDTLQISGDINTITIENASGDPICEFVAYL